MLFLVATFLPGIAAGFTVAAGTFAFIGSSLAAGGAAWAVVGPARSPPATRQTATSNEKIRRMGIPSYPRLLHG